MLVAMYFLPSVLVALSIWQRFQVNGSPHSSKSEKCERSTRPLLGAPVADLFALVSNSSEAGRSHGSVFMHCQREERQERRVLPLRLPGPSRATNSFRKSGDEWLQ